MKDYTVQNVRVWLWHGYRAGGGRGESGKGIMDYIEVCVWVDVVLRAGVVDGGLLNNHADSATNRLYIST